MDVRLREQIDYYRARAAEYDDWWMRRGSYELPAELQEKWFRDVAQVEAALHEFAPEGRVLELACGTGLFTQLIAQHSEQITALDSSPEVIEVNRARLGETVPEYVVADVFAWSFPKAAYDEVVFTYWLSHVPDEHLDTFWDSVRATLRPGGRVFLADSSSYPSTTAADPGGATELRTLHDGRSFSVLKRYWRPDELKGYLTERQWSCQATLSENQMILYASAHPH